MKYRRIFFHFFLGEAVLALPSFRPLLLLDYPPESFLDEACNVRGHKLFFVCEPLPRFKEHGLGCLFSSKVGRSCSRLLSETPRCSPLQALIGTEMSPRKTTLSHFRTSKHSRSCCPLRDT